MRWHVSVGDAVQREDEHGSRLSYNGGNDLYRIAYGESVLPHEEGREVSHLSDPPSKKMHHQRRWRCGMRGALILRSNGCPIWRFGAFMIQQ